MEPTIKAMKECMKIQGGKGNWDYDDYMCGMYNGMELMLSLAEKRDPMYRRLPQKSLIQKIRRWWAMNKYRFGLHEKTISASN